MINIITIYYILNIIITIQILNNDHYLNVMNSILFVLLFIININFMTNSSFTPTFSLKLDLVTHDSSWNTRVTYHALNPQ